MKVRGPLVAAAAGLALLAASAFPRAAPVFVWNRTESLPGGLYLIAPRAPLRRGDIVAYTPDPAESAWLEARRYTGPGWPLIKRIAGLEGDEVCRQAQTVQVNEVRVALARGADSDGRTLPVWSGCHVLGAQEVFLLGDHARSVDGRYFGVQARSRILGRARRLGLPRRPGPCRQDEKCSDGG